MPSPVGHALGGLIGGWIVAGSALPGPDEPPRRAREPLARPVLRAFAFAAVGMAADFDLLLHRHSQFTHSVGAVLLVFAAAAGLLRGRPRWLPLALAFAAAYASHPLLDWLGEDATPPLGIMALWPFSRGYFLSHADVFRGISRELWKPGAVRHDVLAVVREVAILAPLAFAAWRVRSSGSGSAQRIRQPRQSRAGTQGPGESSRDQ